MPNASISHNLGAQRASNFMSINAGRLQKSQDELSSGSRVSNPTNDPSSAAVGNILGSQIASSGQAFKNTTQGIALLQLATGALGNNANILTRLKELCTQANTDTIDNSERIMLDQEYQRLVNQINVNAAVKWCNTELFTGKAGNATFHGVAAVAPAAAVAIPASAGGVVGADLVFQAATSTGYISGSAESVEVRTVGVGSVLANTMLEVSVVIGGQTFKGNLDVLLPPVGGAAVLNNGFDNTRHLILKSTTDGRNVIDLIGSAAVAAAPPAPAAGTAGLQTAVAIEGALANYFGLKAGAPASFVSASATGSFSQAAGGGAAGGIAAAAGVAVGPANLETVKIFSGASMAPGVYALNYAWDAHANTGTFEISDGWEIFRQTVTADQYSMVNLQTFEGEVFFDNGFKMAFTEGFNLERSIAQRTLLIGEGGALTRVLQTGQDFSDTISIVFDPLTASTLFLSDTAVGTQADAITASQRIDAAQGILGQVTARLGGYNAQLNATALNLSSVLENLATAKGSFTDASITEALTQSQIQQALVKVAASMLQQTLAESGRLAALVEQVSR